MQVTQRMLISILNHRGNIPLILEFASTAASDASKFNQSLQLPDRQESSPDPPSVTLVLAVLTPTCFKIFPPIEMSISSAGLATARNVIFTPFAHHAEEMNIAVCPDESRFAISLHALGPKAHPRGQAARPLVSCVLIGSP